MKFSAARFRPAAFSFATFRLSVVLTAVATAGEGGPLPAPGGEPAAAVEARVDDLLRRMTPEEMADLLATNYWTTNANARLGIPALRMVNGSYGPLHGHATAFPASVALAASFDPDLVAEVGAAIGREARADGYNTLLGPVIIMHRLPQAGRNAESYSEDPYLASRIVTAHIRGVQSQGVIATAAFLAGKLHELGSHYYDVRVSARALHEIYLPAFKAAVQDAGVWAIMTPYNRLNGADATSNPYLLDTVLRRQWGFRGVVMTDWAGVQNFKEGLYAGVDLDMPHGRTYRREAILAVLRGAEGPVYQGKVVACVRRILRAMAAMGLFERPATENIAVDFARHQALSLRAARESIVLLKNESQLLPLDASRLKSIAVIGPNAAIARTGIHGASRVIPRRTVSPLAGVRAAVGPGVTVTYAKGCNTIDRGPLLNERYVTTPDGQPGFLVEYFNNGDFAGPPVASERTADVNFRWVMSAPHPAVTSAAYSVRIRGRFVPPASGRHEFWIGHGKSPLRYRIGARASELDGKGDLWDESWFTRVQNLTLAAGQPVPVLLEFRSAVEDPINPLELRWNYLEPDPLPKAVAAARAADVALVFAGFNDAIEGENDQNDRTPNLPPEQEELIRAVAAANKHTVVVFNAGSAVVMDRWEPLVPAVLDAFYPGQEGGTALADILFGRVNPSGRLPCTFMRRWEDSPAYGTYPYDADRFVHLNEGIYVGYRWFDRPDAVPPLFTFGHGLSYTKFAYDNLAVTPAKVAPGRPVKVAVRVRNTGDRAGAEVVQLYLGDDKASVDRPVRELKAFRKVVLAAGETKTVELTIPPEALQFFDPRVDGWLAEPGTFTISAGASSRDIRLTGRFELGGPFPGGDLATPSQAEAKTP